mmetsp:Transcript_59875/g.175688  ORF Transcript_59875/g.175688 Transcript_59875/m.175688 type:complete len:598 (-) Transcript_59875:29-1822(-)
MAFDAAVAVGPHVPVRDDLARHVLHRHLLALALKLAENCVPVHGRPAVDPPVKLALPHEEQPALQGQVHGDEGGPLARRGVQLGMAEVRHQLLVREVRRRAAPHDLHGLADVGLGEGRGDGLVVVGHVHAAGRGDVVHELPQDSPGPVEVRALGDVGGRRRDGHVEVRVLHDARAQDDDEVAVAVAVVGADDAEDVLVRAQLLVLVVLDADVQIPRLLRGLRHVLDQRPQLADRFFAGRGQRVLQNLLPHLLCGRGGRGVRALEARLDHRPRQVREEVHVALPHPVPPQEVAESGVREQARGDRVRRAARPQALLLGARAEAAVPEDRAEDDLAGAVHGLQAADVVHEALRRLPRDLLDVLVLLGRKDGLHALVQPPRVRLEVHLFVEGAHGRKVDTRRDALAGVVWLLKLGVQFLAELSAVGCPPATRAGAAAVRVSEGRQASAALGGAGLAHVSALHGTGELAGWPVAVSTGVQAGPAAAREPGGGRAAAAAAACALLDALRGPGQAAWPVAPSAALHARPAAAGEPSAGRTAAATAARGGGGRGGKGRDGAGRRWWFWVLPPLLWFWVLPPLLRRWFWGAGLWAHLPPRYKMAQ